MTNRGLDLSGASSSLVLGNLSGSVSVGVVASSSLTLNDFHLSGFTGAFTGAGTLQLVSAGTQTLRAGGFTGSTQLQGTGDAVYQTLAASAPAGPITVASGVRLVSPAIQNTSMNVAGTLELTAVASGGGPSHGGCQTGSYTQGPDSRLILTIHDRPSRADGFGKVVATGTAPGGFATRDYRFHQPINNAPAGFLRIRYKGLTTHPDD